MIVLFLSYEAPQRSYLPVSYSRDVHTCSYRIQSRLRLGHGTALIETRTRITHFSKTYFGRGEECQEILPVRK